MGRVGAEFHPKFTHNGENHLYGKAPDSHHSHTFKLRIEFPKFSGDNPRLWICKCMKYFNFHPINDHDKLLLAAITMEMRLIIGIWTILIVEKT